MLAELSTTSTTRCARACCQRKIGSPRAKTSSARKASCSSSESQCRSRCHNDRGFFSSKICSQKSRVETGIRRNRIFRM